MGFDFNPTTWFVCRLCHHVFPNSEKLKDHKLENHLGDCLKIKTIIFEEKILDCEWTPAIPVVENFQNPYVSLVKLKPHQISAVLNKSAGGINDSIADSPCIEKTKISSPSICCKCHLPVKPPCFQQSNSVHNNTDKIPQQILSIAESQISKDESDDDSVTEVPSDIESLLSISRENHHEKNIVLGDGIFTVDVGVTETSADGAGEIQLESTEEVIDLTEDTNEDLNSISKIQEPPDNSSGETEVESILNDFRASPAFSEKRNTNSLISGFEVVPSPNLTRRSIRSPSKTLFRGNKAIKVSSSQPQPQPSTAVKSRIIKTYSKSKPVQVLGPDTKNPGIDLELHIPLTQWLLKQRNQNPSNLYLLTPKPSTIVSVNYRNQVKCKLCQKSFHSQIDLRLHVLKCWNFNKGEHCYCHICKTSYGSHDSLKHHNELHHSVKSPQVRIDQRTVQENALQASDFLKVIETVPVPVVQPNFKCNFGNCTSSFDSANSLWKHKRDNHLKELGPPEYCCPVPNCTVTFGVKSSVICHLQTDHGKTYNGEVIIAKYPKETKRSKLVE